MFRPDRHCGATRPHGPRVRHVSIGSGSPDTVNPFGQTPYRQAGRFGSQFANPLAWGFGIGRGKKANQFLSDLEAGKYEGSPLASFIQSGRDVLPEYQNQMGALGQEIATRAPQLFGQYQGAIENYLKALPQYEQQANQGAQLAQQSLQQAYSPIQSQALYQNAYSDALKSSQASAAGRGLLDAGSQVGQEEDLARQLANQFAERRFGEQQQALQGVQGATGFAAQLAGLAPAARQALFEAYPQLAQLQQLGVSLPFNALQQVLGFLSSTQNPTLALLQATAPTVAQQQKQTGVL